VPNGKPGDHPYTDIVIHKRRVYSAAIDDLVRAVAQLSDERGRNALADELFGEYNEYSRPDLAKLERTLAARLQQLRAAAKARGWEEQG
jgi:hypothetical protein